MANRLAGAADQRNLADLAGARLGPGFGLVAELVLQPLDSPTEVLQPVAGGTRISGLMIARARLKGRGITNRSQVGTRQGRSWPKPIATSGIASRDAR